MMRGRELLLGALVLVGCVGDSNVPNKDGGSDATTNDAPSGNDAGSDAGACKSGDFRCTGLSLEQCQNGSYVLYKQCITAALCDPDAGACQAAVCQPGDLRCSGAKFQKCNGGQNGFDDVKSCATAALCRSDAGVDGGCIPPACQPGDMNCNPSGNACPGGHSCTGTCNSNQTGFDLTEDCGFGQGFDCCNPAQNSSFCTATPPGC